MKTNYSKNVVKLSIRKSQQHTLVVAVDKTLNGEMTLHKLSERIYLLYYRRVKDTLYDS